MLFPSNVDCWLHSKAHFTLGVRPNVQPKSSIPVEIGPKGFTLGVKTEIEKIISICPKQLINAELYGLVDKVRRLEKGYPRIWEANLQPLGPMFQYLSIF
jgi:hypothetical protein